MPNSMVLFTFCVLYRKLPFWLTKVNEVRCPRDLAGEETLKYAAVVNTAFLFCCWEIVRGLFLCAALKIFK